MRERVLRIAQAVAEGDHVNYVLLTTRLQEKSADDVNRLLVSLGYRPIKPSTLRPRLLRLRMRFLRHLVELVEAETDLIGSAAGLGDGSREAAGPARR